MMKQDDGLVEDVAEPDGGVILKYAEDGRDRKMYCCSCGVPSVEVNYLSGR